MALTHGVWDGVELYNFEDAESDRSVNGRTEDKVASRDGSLVGQTAPRRNCTRRPTLGMMCPRPFQFLLCEMRRAAGLTEETKVSTVTPRHRVPSQDGNADGMAESHAVS